MRNGIPNCSPQSINPETSFSRLGIAQNALNSVAQEVPRAEIQCTPSSSSFDVVVPSASSSGRSRYWGSSSAFALTVEVLQHAVTKALIPLEDVSGQGDNDDAEVDRVEEHPTVFKHQWTEIDEQDIQALVQLYLVTLNTMYGFVDHSETKTDLEAYLDHRRQPQFSQQTLHADQAHRYFRISMMCAISCANQARHQPHRTAECLAYYNDAITCVEEVTSEATPASLQALLLLIVFCLFKPRTGDIWKLLDYACRLTIELGYHTEDFESDPSLYENTGASAGNIHSSGIDGTTMNVSESAQSRTKLRRSTFWGLYAIERIVGQLFGRGSDLPETIITAQYPNSLAAPSGISPLAAGGRALNKTNLMSELGMDQDTLQSMSIAHHYRLVYLRSEIFRTMYLPACPPDLGLDWLMEKYQTLFMWRQELEVSDDLAGVATLTCDVGFDATMCFLFQPLLMKALKATQRLAEAPDSTSSNDGSTGASDERAAMRQSLSLTGNNSHPPKDHQWKVREVGIGDTNEGIFIASDPFYSAINLIQTYEKIVRAPKNSQLGIYPMTFLSAHYIYLASSTLLAHALLRIDGRVQTLRRLCEMSKEPGSDESLETEELDWGAFMDVSTSCLILLAWCVERWPGMLGMLEVYQRLFHRVTRELIKQGTVH